MSSQTIYRYAFETENQIVMLMNKAPYRPTHVEMYQYPLTGGGGGICILATNEKYAAAVVPCK
jgi:hypothetical protein